MPETASSGVTPTSGVPAEPPSPDAQAHANDNTETRDNLLKDLNEVREKLSALMGQDFADMRSPVPLGGRLQETPERMERTQQQAQLHEREHQISVALKEQTQLRVEF